MKKLVYVEGMNCGHCSSKVESVLNQIEGVKAKVNLKKNLVKLKLKNEVEDNLIIQTIEDVGYTVTSIE